MTIVLTDPKFAHNVGQVVRAASCFGVDEILMTGHRVELEGRPGYRLPREERMRSRYPVQVRPVTRPIDELAPGVVPVAVELVAGAEDMIWFEHPARAAYVFGPEDGHLDASIRRLCHRHVFLPMASCANLASAVWMTLYDRHAKAVRAGLEPSLRLVPEGVG